MAQTCAGNGAGTIPPWALAPLSGWALTVCSLHVAGLRQPPALTPAIHFIAADGFIVGAALRLLLWRSSGAQAQRRQAIALGAASLLFPVTATLSPWSSDLHLTPTGVITRGFVLAGIVPFLLRGPACPGRGWSASFLVLAEVLRVVGPLPGNLDDLATGLVFTAAMLLASSAMADFRNGLRARATHEDALALELATTQAQFELARQAQRERLHDARSAVAGVLGASAVLGNAQVPGRERDDLQRLIGLEIARLATVLGLEPAEPVAPFDVREALLPLLRLHRLGCPHLTWHLADTLALGRVRTTATALDNLLRNAATHAPGAPVRVMTRQRGDAVEIVVEDDGPGIPEPERALVVQPGRRGTGAVGPGSGLGLSNAASAMAEQGGRLLIGRAESGGTRVTLELPVPAAHAVAC